jgi:FtsP/CotA-like multicopper oxidase with cupredoxin domain
MITRRQFLGTVAAAIAVPPFVRNVSADTPDLIVRITAEPRRISLFQGQQTHTLGYIANVLHGRTDAVKSSAGAFGPTLELKRGERVRIHFVNRMKDPSIIHWHGMIVPDQADGHPRFAVGEDGEYVYEFVVRNPAGTYLYHPHPHGMTGAQVYRGLAGMLIVREPNETERGLPAVEHELALAIQDRRISADNQFVYQRTMMDRMNGVLGDEVLVNGIPDAAFTVAPRPYRLRLANVSNARIYKLAWSDGRPMQVIATDNGLLSAAEGPKELPYLTLAPFERVELLEDFGERRVGADVALVSGAFSLRSGMMGGRMGGGMMGGMMNGMMGGMMSGGQGQELTVARFTVGSGTRVRGVPLALPAATPAIADPVAQLQTQLSFRHMQGFLDGRSFEMTDVADDEHMPLGKSVSWTFSNDGPGMAMPHPMHVHGVRFRILERRGGEAADDLREGIISAGFKDTFLILSGETVRVAFTPTEPGLFMVHCHNLEHEDGGMMRNFRVG